MWSVRHLRVGATIRSSWPISRTWACVSLLTVRLKDLKLEVKRVLNARPKRTLLCTFESAMEVISSLGM